MPTTRFAYGDPITDFLARDPEQVLGRLFAHGVHGASVEATQRDAWLEQTRVLQRELHPFAGRGAVYFEYAIPRLGRRVDAVALVDSVVFVLEFKVGESQFTAAALDQVWDYALDLKNFHEPTHGMTIVPVLIATRAEASGPVALPDRHADGTLPPVRAAPSQVGDLIATALAAHPAPGTDAAAWASGRYRPTPTIIEAATALYRGHSVADIARSDAGATNLTRTSAAVERVIAASRDRRVKSICFVTGVPGAGKTLVGLNVATRHADAAEDLHSVFLSGNGPLVAVLREALALDKVRAEAERGRRVTKGAARSEVQAFVQNVHHFRDDCLIDAARPPVERVAIFDEAQRAWDRAQMASFMARKKGRPDFDASEPQFLISCLDRHADWATVVCLVGGGQEINTGEAGIGEWVDALLHAFPAWHVYVSSRLTDAEYGAGAPLARLAGRANVTIDDDLHLGVSMRSFRAEHVSLLVKQLLDLDPTAARATLASLRDRYPIVLTRDLAAARGWLRGRARGSERYGIVCSSQAQRLKPHAIDVRVPLNPVHWFLNDKRDVRSSYYLEDAATEFDVQGLELDWACVAWDADFRLTGDVDAAAGDARAWEHWSFKGKRWQRVRQPRRRTYLKNAYRVLLTRARQGMVIAVPEGDRADPTRRRAYYDETFDYLAGIGFDVL